MKVHVTGANGFVGRNLIPRLLQAGHQVTPAFTNVDAVIHLAGIAHRKASPEELLEVNVRLTERLARQAADLGAHFLFISSVKVHGEESSIPFKEDSPILPEDPYAESKARAEEALRCIAGLRLSIFRPPLIYGPGVKANFRKLMAAVARGWPLPLASIVNRRNVLYVGNLASAVLACLERGRLARQCYLVADQPPISTPELCLRLGEAVRRPARLIACPVMFLKRIPGMRPLTQSLELDDSLTRSDLSWRPISIGEGLLATAEWYLRR